MSFKYKVADDSSLLILGHNQKTICRHECIIDLYKILSVSIGASDGGTYFPEIIWICLNNFAKVGVKQQELKWS